MDVQELYQDTLEAICRRLYPTCEVEIRELGGSLYPYILDGNCEEVDSGEIAQRLSEYQKTATREELRAIRSMVYFWEIFGEEVKR